MSTSNGNGQAPPRTRRQLLRERESARVSTVHHLLEYYLSRDEFYLGSDLWDRTRGDYLRTLPSRPSDRKGGRAWPVWQFDQDLDRIRQQARIVCTVNSYAKGFLANMVNHIVGKGCQYKVVSKEGTPDADLTKPGPQSPEWLTRYVAKCQDVVDRFLRKNRWNVLVDPKGPLTLNGSREREIVIRDLRDGEVFLRFYVVAGELLVRFIEPEQVRHKPGALEQEGWTFGIQHHVGTDDEGNPLIDVETIKAYYVWWSDPFSVKDDSAGKDFGEEVSADHVLHAKGIETDSTIKRGVSFFSWDVVASFERARVLQRNVSISAAVKAAIAETWKHLYGTESEVASFRQGQREGYTERAKADGNTETENFERRYPGMVRDIPDGMEPVYPGPDNTPQWLQGSQADLQQAVAGGCAPLYWAADTSMGTYAGLKEAGAPAVKMADSRQTYYTAIYARVVWKALQVAVESGQLEDHLHLIDLQVEAPVVLQRDRLQVAQESQILNQLGALSPQTVCMEAGRDYEIEAKNLQEHVGRFGHPGMPLGLPDGQGNLPDTHGRGDDAGGALHDDKTLATQQDDEPQADVLQGQPNDLRTTVGGLNAIAQLQAQFYAGKIPREAVIANVQLLFGFSPEEAASLFPEIAPQKLTADEPEPGQDAGAGADPFASVFEAVLEAAGTCKPGERSDLTGCTPATGTGAADPHAAAHDKAGKLAAMGDKLSAAGKAAVVKAGAFVAQKYAALEKDFGRAGAIAILAACVALTPVPVPGSSLAPIALAKGYLAVKKRLGGS